MDDDVRAFGEELGRRALARDWSAVHERLAPWLRASLTPDSVRSFFENEYRAEFHQCHEATRAHRVPGWQRTPGRPGSNRCKHAVLDEVAAALLG